MDIAQEPSALRDKSISHERIPPTFPLDKKPRALDVHLSVPTRHTHPVQVAYEKVSPQPGISYHRPTDRKAQSLSAPPTIIKL